MSTQASALAIDVSKSLAIVRYTYVIGDELRFRNNERRASEVAVAVHVLNRMLELARPICVRIG